MRRLIPLLLAVLLLLCLTACGDSKTSPETKAPETQTPATEAPTTKAPETEAATTEAPQEGPALSHGTVEGDTYINEALNVQIKAPQGWVFFTDEQIAAQNGLTVDMFEGTKVADAIDKAGQMIDMLVQSANGSNANLVIQASQPVLAIYNDDQLFTLMEDTYRDQLEGTGMEIKEYEVAQLRVFGEDRPALRMVLEMQGRSITEYQIWLRDNPSYSGILTMTLTDDGDPQAFFDGLSRLN